MFSQRGSICTKCVEYFITDVFLTHLSGFFFFFFFFFFVTELGIPRPNAIRWFAGSLLFIIFFFYPLVRWFTLKIGVFGTGGSLPVVCRGYLGPGDVSACARIFRR